MHSDWITAILWLTNRPVLPCAAVTLILPRHLFLKREVADRQHLIDQQDFGSRWAATANARRRYMPLEYRFTGVSRNSSISGERDDLIELAFDVRSCHTEDRAIQVNVFAAGELVVETGADFEQVCRRGRRFDRVRLVGSVIRERILRSVLLPAPLRPISRLFAPAVLRTTRRERPSV